jgi:hypothetical protein
MRLTFKVGLLLPSHRLAWQAEDIHLLTLVQDLKQQKFVIEAEPTELVRHPLRSIFNLAVPRNLLDIESTADDHSLT